MSHQLEGRRGRWVVAAPLALAVIVALSVAGMATARTAKSCGTVTLNGQGTDDDGTYSVNGVPYAPVPAFAQFPLSASTP